MKIALIYASVFALASITQSMATVENVTVSADIKETDKMKKEGWSASIIVGGKTILDEEIPTAKITEGKHTVMAAYSRKNKPTNFCKKEKFEFDVPHAYSISVSPINDKKPAEGCKIKIIETNGETLLPSPKK